MNDSNNYNWLNNQSKTIDLLRFPLAILVVFIHWGIFFSDKGYYDTNYNFLSDEGICQFFCFSISKGIAEIAVPTFFLISGYLFFANFQKLTLVGYFNKLKSRVKTLLIPYLIWNTFILLIFLIVYKLGYMRKGDDFISNLQRNPFTYLYNLHNINDVSPKPIDYPLWFIRDLIIINILSPIIYYLIKITKIFGVIIIFILGITNLWPNYVGFSNITYEYFSLGAYFALNNFNIAKFSRKIFKISTPIFILTYTSTIYCNYNNIKIEWLFTLFILFSIFESFAITSFLYEKNKIKDSPLLISSCFFIFASHSIIINILKRINYYSIPNSILYFLIPFLIISLLIIIYKLIKILMPKIANLISGTR